MMKIKRRHFLSLGAGVVAMPAVLRIARADDYPSRPVRIIVPYPPGIAPDIATRLLTDSLSQKFRQQFIVDNRPGGAANIGTEMVVRAAPDGYTLLTLTMTNSINVSLYDNLSFDITKDIAPVSGLVKLPLVIVVNPVVPAKTLPEFIAYAKANPGKINYPSVGAGAATNMAGELFKQMAGVDIVNVPYKNSYIPDLLAGQVQAGFTPILQVLPFIQAGKLIPLAITGATHSEVLPALPNASEFVPGYEVVVWDAVGAPAHTPPDILAKLNKTINEALAEPAMQKKFADLGSEPMIASPGEVAKYMADEVAKWGKVVREAHIKPD
jgi:tripartite-type tricarboxylate transporter receptor subunit TctC